MRNIKTYILSTLLTFTMIAPSLAKDQSAVCAFRVENSKHDSHAIVKCALDSSPGQFVIRNTASKKHDPKQFKAMAQHAGRQYKCVLEKGNRRRRGNTLITDYEMKVCE